MESSEALFFDDYDIEGPDDFTEWVKRGADHNEWIVTPIINEITSILNNSSRKIEYIILDYPFAYLNREMREYIDFSIFIDTPLDVAMARRIFRDFNDSSSVEDIRNDLGVYLSGGRSAYVNMLDTIKPNSDLVIDGLLTIEEIVDAIYKRVKNL